MPLGHGAHAKNVIVHIGREWEDEFESFTGPYRVTC